MPPFSISPTRLNSENRSDNELFARYARVQHTASVGITSLTSSMALTICAGTRSETSSPAREPAISPNFVPFGG
jgi:hypothetical protein